MRGDRDGGEVRGGRERVRWFSHEVRFKYDLKGNLLTLRE